MGVLLDTDRLETGIVFDDCSAGLIGICDVVGDVTGDPCNEVCRSPNVGRGRSGLSKVIDIWESF